MAPGEPGVFEPHWVQRPGTRVSKVHRPALTVGAVARLLAEDPTRRLVAGGTDLTVDLDRSSGPDVELIDVSGISPLVVDMPKTDDMPHGSLRLGCGVTHNEVVDDAGVIESALPLAQACLEIGSPQLRNRATVVGNVVTASPANDTISALMALGAGLEVVTFVDGQVVSRHIPLDGFFLGVRQTQLEPSELVSAITVPKMGPSERGVWVKAGLRSAQAISVVHAGLWVAFDADGSVADARIALGSVAPTVVLSPAASLLIGHPLDPDVVQATAAAAAAAVDPIDDGRATADYRSHTVETVVARALRSLAANTQTERWPARVPVLTDAPRSGFRETASVIDDATEIAVTINGTATQANGAASVTLLDWLREHAGTGTKEGCAEGECGACTVMLDGRAVMSCLTTAAQADGSEVTTVEGLADGETLSEMQQSFVDNFAVQCGYCIPGFVVSATALRNEIEDPTREEIELGLSGNLCRCTGYYAILEAVRAAGKDGGQ